MPRKPRCALPVIPVNVIQRGNDREPCFLADQDYRRYLNDLGAVARKHRCRLPAYVLTRLGEPGRPEDQGGIRCDTSYHEEY